VRIRHDEEHPHAASAQRLGAEGVVRWRLIGDPERGIPDRELCDDRLVFIGAADPVDLHGSERRLVELDRGATAPDRQLRPDARHRALLTRTV
jgi:hypothetical protein